MTADPRRIAIAFCAICAFLNLYSAQSVLPFIARELGTGAAEASMILTGGTLAVALTAPFTGAISDLVGRKWMIVSAMAMIVAPTLMISLSQTLPELVLWRFVQGLMLPPIFTVAIAYVGDEWSPREAVKVIGIYSASSAIGGFSGRLLTGAFADSYSWRGGFVAIAVINLVCLAMVVWLLPREKNFEKASSLYSSIRQMLNHLRNPRLLATYAIGFGVMFTFMGTFTYISFHLAAPPFNRTALFLGAIFFVYLGGTALAPWSGHFINRLGRRVFVLSSLAVCAIGLLLTLSPSVVIIIVGLAIFSTSGILIQATSTGFVAVNAPAGTSSAVGLYVTSFYLGGTVGGWVPGLAYEAGGWPGSLITIAAVIGTMAAIVLLWWEEPKAETS